MSRTRYFLNYFLSHRKVTNELISKIGQEQYDYKPTETSMPASKLATHILDATYKFVASAKEGNIQPFREKFIEETDLQKLSEIYTDKTISLLESFTDEDFNRIIDASKMFGVQLPVHEFLRVAIDHEIHHKGALFIYVREMGYTELPFYIKYK